VAREKGTVARGRFAGKLGMGSVAGMRTGDGAVLFLSIMLPLLQILGVEADLTELPGVFRTVPGVIWNSFAFSAGTATLCVGIAMVAPLLPIRLLTSAATG